MEPRLGELFRATGGSGHDYLSPENTGAEPGVEFLRNFKTPFTGANGSGPILNANANLLPTRADQYRESADFNDFRLGDGLGLARPYRKNDSMGGQTGDGFLGFAYPSKMFGRDSKTYDLNYKRDEMTERARATFKKMGFKANEVPQQADYMPWEWYNLNALGIGGTPIHNPNQYNRNYSLPDADMAARRLYQPAPSRLTKMIQTDVEVAALTPNRTLLHPLKVVTEDRQRMKLQRVSRNVDVIEAVTYENGMFPRGITSKTGAPRVYGDTDVLRQPVGTNDTGDRSCDGRWENGFSEVNPLLDATLEDKLVAQKNAYHQIEGKDLERETSEFRASEVALMRQRVLDYNNVDPRRDEFPHGRSGINGPLVMPASVPREI